MGFEAIGKITTVCGCITAIGAVAALIIALVRKFKEPNVLQDKRLDELETRLEKIDARLDDHDQYFKNDLMRFEKLEEGNRIMQQCMLALLSHGIDGNDVESMQKAKKDLQDYLIYH